MVCWSFSVFRDGVLSFSVSVLVSAPERMITLFPTAKSFAFIVWQKKPNMREPN
jgi:hypothetical protein